jgi:hypothetical protein
MSIFVRHFIMTFMYIVSDYYTFLLIICAEFLYCCNINLSLSIASCISIHCFWVYHLRSSFSIIFMLTHILWLFFCLRHVEACSLVFARKLAVFCLYCIAHSFFIVWIIQFSFQHQTDVIITFFTDVSFWV